LKIPYKVFPIEPGHPQFGDIKFSWMPMLNVRLIIKHAKTMLFEAVVDSGSATCLFHSDIGRRFGLRVEEGAEGPLGGVIAGEIRKVYYHDVKLAFGEHMVPVRAGFSDSLSVPGLLGRTGFFEHFSVTFDPANNPPGMVIQRIHRA
jgi:hypothetical protein